MFGVLRFIAYLMCRIFFRRISISGKPYCGGSTIWAGNHSSGIVDPAVIMGLSPVSIRPLAKHTLWDIPPMRFLLQVFRAIPVKRVQDIRQDVVAQKEQIEQGNFDPGWRAQANGSAFAEVSQALLNGDNILIFPEGVSHDDPYLYEFKTGFARMALQTLAQSHDKNFKVVVQPFILDYSEKDEFRSELNLHFCKPVEVSNKNLQVKEVMNHVRKSMEEGHASFFTWDEKRNWRFIFEVANFRAPFSSKEFREFVETYRPDFDLDAVLLGKIQTMRRMLQAIHVSPLQLVWGDLNYKKKNFFLVIVSHALFFLFVTIPVLLFGSIVWVIPSKVCEILAKRSTSDRDVRATMKIAHGTWFFPVWAFLMSTVFTHWLGSYGLFVDIPKVILWLLFLVLTPTFLVLSLVLNEAMNFFPGFLRLTILRAFFPRGWYELFTEWRDISDGILNKIQSVIEKN